MKIEKIFNENNWSWFKGYCTEAEFDQTQFNVEMHNQTDKNNNRSITKLDYYLKYKFKLSDLAEWDSEEEISFYNLLAYRYMMYPDAYDYWGWWSFENYDSSITSTSFSRYLDYSSAGGWRYTTKSGNKDHPGGLESLYENYFYYLYDYNREYLIPETNFRTKLRTIAADHTDKNSFQLTSEGKEKLQTLIETRNSLIDKAISQYKLSSNENTDTEIDEEETEEDTNKYYTEDEEFRLYYQVAQRTLAYPVEGEDPLSLKSLSIQHIRQIGRKAFQQDYGSEYESALEIVFSYSARNKNLNKSYQGQGEVYWMPRLLYTSMVNISAKANALLSNKLVSSNTTLRALGLYHT
jgi:hypothetical protein